MSGLESVKLQITMEKQLNLENDQQINQMKWIKTHWVEMVGRPRQRSGRKVEKGIGGVVMEREHLHKRLQSASQNSEKIIARNNKAIG